MTGRRSGESKGGGSEGTEQDTNSAGAVLCCWARTCCWYCPVEADRTRRESVRPRFSDRWHSCRESHHEFRGADGGALQCRCQFVFRGATGFFTRARRLSSRGACPIEREEHAGGCGAGFGGGDGRVHRVFRRPFVFSFSF